MSIQFENIGGVGDSPPAQAEAWMATMMTNDQHSDSVRSWAAEQNRVGEAMHEAAPHPSLHFPELLGIEADTPDGRIDLQPEGVAEPGLESVVVIDSRIQIGRSLRMILNPHRFL